MREQGFFPCEEIERYFGECVRLLMLTGKVVGDALGWYKIKEVTHRRKLLAGFLKSQIK